MSTLGLIGMVTTRTREAWLGRAAKGLSDLIPAPAAYLSVGFPKGVRGGKTRVLGQCWAGSLSTDGRPHIFITPEQPVATDVLATLAHELCHAATPGAGHRGAFVTLARKVGFLAPWTSTPCGPELAARLNALAAQLGPYPHAALIPLAKPKPGSRLRLWQCQCEPPVKVRVAKDDFAATCDECCEHFEQQS